jgi:hypothetical protein
MWLKTGVGLILSLLVCMSLLLNLAYLVPMSRDIYLLFGFVGTFVIWASLMTYFYSEPTITKPVKYSFTTLLISGLVNAFFYFEVLA